MSEVRYAPDDMVVLHARTLDGVAQQVTVRIVACQPETRGTVRYRVRLTGENFDRTVSSHDIDTMASPARGTIGKSATSRPEPGSSWINAAKIRTRK
ncbi:hypothetical protein SAMN05421890_1890 [Ensifer adhaerens]|nr:hypothetical protein SAMN05421890_1890 [Ensifer adhaerens]HZG28970.1 cold-shock protein [Ensifer sp.]